MPLLPVAPPQPVPIFSSFDYVTVDAQHRNVIAAHTGARSLLIVDADTGKIKANVRIGACHGVAYDPASGHVFAGTSEGKIVEVDVDAKQVVQSASVDGEVDAIAYDATLGRIYADEDDGTKVWVIDAKTFKPLATVAVPGHKPEYLAVDPQTHDVYQNIANTAEVAVIDARTLSVRTSFKTPELISNHPLQYDALFGQIVTAGSNGVMSAYDRSGKLLGRAEVPKGIDQCDLDAALHVLACAHGNGVTLVQLARDGAPNVSETAAVPPGTHSVGIDAQTHDLWIVWAKPDGSGDFVQRLSRKPAP